MDERTIGLILRTRPLTETSLIVHWLTPDLGRFERSVELLPGVRSALLRAREAGWKLAVKRVSLNSGAMSFKTQIVSVLCCAKATNAPHEASAKPAVIKTFFMCSP